MYRHVRGEGATALSHISGPILFSNILKQKFHPHHLHRIHIIIIRTGYNSGGSLYMMMCILLLSQDETEVGVLPMDGWDIREEGIW